MTQPTSFMTFVTQPSNLILDNNIDTEINNFWHGRELGFTVGQDTEIISVATQIPSVDPLACLKKLGHNDTLNFYWENCSKHEAVAAWGVTIRGNTDPEARFSSAQSLIQNWFSTNYAGRSKHHGDWQT